ncbi:MAG: tail fiber domain-containing protein, partial [Planctomycetes bacterium]|nr:tail fiber domain-containing protein [Planctomycetota bacterium]
HIVGNLFMDDGNQQSGFVMASDANGMAAWTNLTSLTVSSQWITSSSNIHFSSADVGIGTATPGANLHVNGNVRFDNQLFLANGSVSAPALAFVNDTVTGLYLADTAGDLVFVTAATNRLLIDSAGNISIGGETASSPLDLTYAGTVGVTTDYLEITNSAVSANFTNKGIGIVLRQSYNDGTQIVSAEAARISAVMTNVWNPPTHGVGANSSKLVFQTRYNNTLNAAMTLDEKMHVDLYNACVGKDNTSGYSGGNLNSVFGTNNTNSLGDSGNRNSVLGFSNTLSSASGTTQAVLIGSSCSVTGAAALSNPVVVGHGLSVNVSNAGAYGIDISNTLANSVAFGILNTKMTLNTATAAAGNEVVYDLIGTVNKAAGDYTGFRLNVTETSAPGNATLMNLQVGSSTKFIVKNTGATGIGIDNPSATLHVNGNALFAGNILPAGNNSYDLGTIAQAFRNAYVTDLTVLSDRRLKQDIEPLTKGLGEVMELRPVTFKMRGGDGVTRMGLIAQEVEEVMIGKAVQTGNDEVHTKGIRYTELIPVLINAIKEQQSMIECLNKKQADSNTRYEKAIEELRHRLDR